MFEWNQKKYEEFIEKESSGLIYLYTPFCGTCQVAGKMLTVADELLPDVVIGKINLNYAPNLAVKWEVESVPCLLFFQKGQLIEKLYAFQSVPFLLDKIKNTIQ
jgi:thioredoxin 1